CSPERRAGAADPRAHDRVSGPKRARISAATSPVLAPAISGRATKTTRMPGFTAGDIVLHASFRMRRARLRATAPPTPRPVTKPARAGPSPGSTYSSIRVPTRPRPRWITSRNSRLLVMRPTRPGFGSSAGGLGSSMSGKWRDLAGWRALRRQTGATLGATAGEDPTPGPGPHANAEAVGLVPFAVVRLIGPFQL